MWGASWAGRNLHLSQRVQPRWRRVVLSDPWPWLLFQHLTEAHLPSQKQAEGPRLPSPYARLPDPLPARSETSLDVGLEVLAWPMFQTDGQTGKQGWCTHVVAGEAVSGPWVPPRDVLLSWEGSRTERGSVAAQGLLGWKPCCTWSRSTHGPTGSSRPFQQVPLGASSG